MADKKFTFFELHLDEGSIQFGPSQIGDVGGETEAGRSTDGDGDADADGNEGCGCPGRAAGKLLAFLVVALVVALAAKKLLGGDATQELDDLDDLAE